MSPKELAKLIQQHGEAAKAHENEAIQIGNAYIIPNFGFDTVMQDALDLLLAPK